MSEHPEFLWTVLAVTLALLALAAWSFYAVWVELRAVRRRLELLEAPERLNKLDANVRGLRQQAANVIAMLLNAGFKAKRAKDWSDDDAKTVARGLGTETQWDWRSPVGWAEPPPMANEPSGGSKP